ncbi:unannotated protein [freshwater metagenome]|uniref:Unannotated protein n=1 Tax=freshwater metagenome TaxID=449393 RepID=A0A6J6F0M1_9ZZZZ
MEVVNAHIGKLSANLANNPRPQPACVDQDVGLVDQRQLLAPRASLLESKSHNSLNTVCGVDGDFVGNLKRRSLAQHATITDIGAFGAFTNDDEINDAWIL